MLGELGNKELLNGEESQEANACGKRADHGIELRDIATDLYAELRALAQVRLTNERCDHTLQPTALVHEVYLKLAESSDRGHWANQAHFFSQAAEAMRRILIDSARAAKSQKRGKDWKRVSLDDVLQDSATADSELLFELDEGLSKLELEDTICANLVKLRLFGGLSIAKAGELLGLSRSVAYENWAYAKSWFRAYSIQS